MFCYIPVSYTHLDVYKRQHYKIPDYEIHPVNREQKIEVNMNIGGVLDETAARVLSDRMPEMLKKNHMQITKQVWKDTEYGMMGK